MATLRASVAQIDDVDLDDAQDAAQSVLERDIQAAAGDPGLKGLDAVRDCATRVDDALARRSEAADDVAARAALLRVDAGTVSPMHYANRVTSESPGWRAVGARSLTVAEVHPEDANRRTANSGWVQQVAWAGKWRRKLMLDPSAAVRRAALRASVDARDPVDEGAVLEAARLDPDQTARLLAIQAAGAIATRGAVIGLKDVWVSASSKERVAIAHAWATAKARSVDTAAHVERDACDTAMCLARDQLVQTMQSDTSLPGLLAALELIHGHAPRDGDRDSEYAASVVERFIDEGTTTTRIEAISSAPLSWAHLLEATVDASTSPDERVAVAAFERVAEVDGEQASEALSRLREFAKGEDLTAIDARRALVRLGDAPVAELLGKDAASSSYIQRGAAARSYAQLGKIGAALRLLADDDVRVRAVAGCALLLAED